MRMRPPLVLTGAPAVGKSTTARELAGRRPRAAVVDVDDVRQLVVAGHAAPWQGEEGLAQQRLGVENACGLAVRFAERGVEVLLADVLTSTTTPLYRALLPGCLVVRLSVTSAEARRRAALRPVLLTADEFASLHADDRDDPPPADHHLDVTDLDVAAQVCAVDRLWQR